MKRPKILFITAARSKRGGHYVFIKLLKELRKQGNDVTLVAFRTEGEPDFPGCEELWRDTTPIIIDIPLCQTEFEANFALINAAKNYLNEQADNYDRIILESFKMCHAAVLANCLSPKVFQLVQSDPEFIPENTSKLWKAAVFELLPRFPVQKIFVSHEIAAVFLKRYQITGQTMDLFIDPEYFAAQFKVKDSKPLKLISTAGDFNSLQKGLDFLLNQLSNFIGFPFSLTIASGEPIKTPLPQVPFPFNITTRDTPEGMVELLLEHDIFISTSTNETFGLCLADAMAMGMPCIALDAVGNRDYMDGKNGVFVKDSKDFLTELNKLQDFKIRESYSRHSRQSMGRYQISKFIEQFKKIVNI